MHMHSKLPCTHRLKDEAKRRKVWCSIRWYTYEQMPRLMFILSCHLVLDGASLSHTRTMDGQWRTVRAQGNGRGNERTRAISEHAHVQSSRASI
jgi:hypothetical protein